MNILFKSFLRKAKFGNLSNNIFLGSGFNSLNLLKSGNNIIKIQNNLFCNDERNGDPRDSRESRGPLKCFNCGEEGHMSRNCPNPKVERRRSNFSSDRGDRGNRDSRGPMKCFNCGEEGHMSRECTQPKAERRERDLSSVTCYKCGEKGHMANDCTSQTSVGGGRGGERTDSRQCYNCGHSGHISRDCPDTPKRKCHNCGHPGHIASQCTEPRRPRDNFDRRV